jgi:hypothetical protein
MLTVDKLREIHATVRRAIELGIDVQPDELELLLDAEMSALLQEVVNGRADDEAIVALVKHHWPDVLLDGWQATLIRHILSGQHSDLNEVLIKGCTKAGKGFAVALASCLWFQAAPECKVIITSQRHKHAHDVMFGEILRCRKQMRYACEGDDLDTRIKTNEQKYVITASPESGEGFSGQHGPATLFIFDEATSISEVFWDLAKTQAACMVALANPRTMSGWFRNAFPSHAPDTTQVVTIPGGRRYLATVGGQDCLNVKAGERRIRDQITKERYLAIRAHPNPRWGDIFADGKFPTIDEDILVISPDWLERHCAAMHDELPIDAFGLDVAASESGDRSEFSMGGVSGCKVIHELQTVDTMRVVAWVIKLAERYEIDLKSGQHPVTVDMDGLGKGTGDRLRELGVWVLEFRGNATSQVDPKQYANLRTESYAELGNRLNPRGSWPDTPWALPRDEELKEDLCAPEKIYQSDGIRFGLTPKDDKRGTYKGETLRQRLGRSPDKGDAVVYLYHAVQELVRGAQYQLPDDLIASGEDPREESRPFDDAELEELDDPFLKELLTTTNQLDDDRERQAYDWE